jgi:hypothetical protein
LGTSTQSPSPQVFPFSILTRGALCVLKQNRQDEWEPGLITIGKRRSKREIIGHFVGRH